MTVDQHPTRDAALDPAALSEADHRIVTELRQRVSTRLSAEDRSYAPGPKRELTRKLIGDEYDQWIRQEANRGRPAPEEVIEETIFAAVLAELDGLGRLAPLLARPDVEDIHFEGSEPTMLRTIDGRLVPGPPIASSDAELEQLLRAIGSRSDGGQTSREFSSASPILNVRLQGVTELGARLQAAMDVLPRPAGVIRVHRFADPSLADLQRMDMVDSALRAFLAAAIEAGISPLVSGAPGVGKTTLLRALGNAIPWNNVVITVEDERELGLHLPRWDAGQQRAVARHAVCRPFESRLPNAEGRGGFDMGDALHLALRASPTWVLVGEVRGAYVTSLLEAATSGIASVMCTIHSPSAEGVFDKVLINALKAHPAPSSELVLRSLAALGLVVHVQRDQNYSRFISGVYELGPVGDSGRPDLRPIFAPRSGDGRACATGAGMLSDSLTERLTGAGFDLGWLHPSASDWQQDYPPGGSAMTPGVLLMTMAGLLIGGGVVATAAAARGHSLVPSTRSGVRPSARRTASPVHLAGLAAGVLVLVLTGWPVAAIATAAGVVFIPKVLGGARASKHLVARSDALADWTRRLADLISSGAAGSTREALRRSLNSAPAPISAAVGNLVNRMGPQGVESALRQFADEIDDPAADKIAMVLILRERNGGPGLAEVLTALAEDLDERSRMIRDVESERAKPRSNMRTIVVTTLVVMVGMVLFARTFLSGYSTAVGQAALLLDMTIFAVALGWMRTLSEPPTWGRVLVDPPAVTVDR